MRSDTYRRLLPVLAWEFVGDPSEPLDPRLLPLLEAVAASGSLAAAVADRGLSYRAAWGLLRDYQLKLDGPLVALERGRGASLAPLGERLVTANALARQRLTPKLGQFAVELAARPKAECEQVGRLRIAASHDLALAALRDALAAQSRLQLDLSFMGSLDALEQYAEARVDIAGFHVPVGARHEAKRAPFRRCLRARRDRLIRFVDREQGLIVPRGNPKRLRTLHDIAVKSARFVNRQRGSGTRWLLDGLFEDLGIDSARIIGYSNEEFTHSAVAATVASGAADAGFGLRAAAAKYSLAFVPQVQERYWLVVRSGTMSSIPVARLVQMLQSSIFARIAKRLPGYRLVAPGVIAGVDALG